jgi:hypothetical protein
LRSNRKKPSSPILMPNLTKPSSPILKPNRRKLSTFVLRLNQETRAPRLLVHSADLTQCHPTSQSLSHRVPDLCNHPWSSAPCLLLMPRSSSLPTMPHLPPAQMRQANVILHTNKIKVVEPSKCLGFEFKPRQVNDSSQSN